MSDKNIKEPSVKEEKKAVSVVKDNKPINDDKKKGKETRPNKDKKPNIFVRFWKKTKEIFSELRKVTWPSMAKTVKQTGVVLGVTLFFVVTIGAFNFLFSYLYTLMTGVSMF